MPLIIADKNGVTDSSFHTLVRHIKTDKTIVMVSWAENFVFNDELLGVKDYVLVDFCEYGWDNQLVDSHIWGLNSEKFPRYYNNDWVKFDNWVKENPTKLLLKRELLKKDVSSIVRPIEYPCVINKWPVQTKEEFDSRPVDYFQYWGRSSEHRLRIHGEIWLDAYRNGFQPCDNIYYINEYLANESGRKAITLWIPHWARMDVNNLMAINNLSKLSLSWHGAGFKCFRHAEAPVNSIMATTKNDYAWSFPWDETNCILVEHGKELEGINEALKRNDLHDIYFKGMETCDKYRLPNYLSHLESIINAA